MALDEISKYGQQPANSPTCVGESDSRLAFSAVLPLRALPRFSSLDLLIAVSKILEGTGAEILLEPGLTSFEQSPEHAKVWNRPKDPPRIGLTVNGTTIAIEGHDRPAFSAGELARMDVRNWPCGQSQIARARAYVEIAEVNAAGGSDIDHNYDRAVAVTAISAAAATLAETVGIVWRPSRCGLPIEQLEPLIAALAQGQAPVSLWLGCPGRPAGAKGAATRGFYPLLGAEIEIESRDIPTKAAFEIALELAAEILRAGEAPGNGARLGYDRNTEFGVRYRRNSHTGAVPAVVLSQLAHAGPVRALVGAA